MIAIIRHSLAYTYGNMMELSLNEFMESWNTHCIRPTHTAGCPAGVPIDLYSLPSLHGNTQCIHNKKFLLSFRNSSI